MSSSTHKKAIPFSLALRLRRICSTDETFKIRTTELTTYLLKRGYKGNFVTKQIQRAADIPLIQTLQPKQTNKPERISFITTYNPSLPSIFNIKKKKKKKKNTTIYFFPLTAAKMLSYIYLLWLSGAGSPNLRDLLVTAKLSPNVTHSISTLPSGSFRCGKNCATCPYIFHGLTNYTFFSNGETRSINSHKTCETKNLIYMIQCKRSRSCAIYST